MMNELFKIFKVSPSDVEKIAASINEPHQHSFQELIIGLKGKMEHFIDFATHTYQAPFVSFVSSGKVHRVRPLTDHNDCDLWVIRFSSELIPETIFHLYAFYHDHANIEMKSGPCFDRLDGICDMLDFEMQQEPPDLSIIRNLLSALFSMIESERKKNHLSEDSILYNTQNDTFRNFLELLETNFREPHGVEFYAEKLFMSSRNLNIVCQQVMQESVSVLIETRKLLEAKHLLITTDKTVSEIGYELGFNEKAYFTNVFKKKSGQTPTEFRQEMRRITSPDYNDPS